jgi:hypothetical protein
MDAAVALIVAVGCAMVEDKEQVGRKRFYRTRLHLGGRLFASEVGAPLHSERRDRLLMVLRLVRLSL